jgi:hypothetical protein
LTGPWPAPTVNLFQARDAAGRQLSVMVR